MGNLPTGYETSSILLSDDLPDNLTYPDTYKQLFKRAKFFLEDE